MAQEIEIEFKTLLEKKDFLTLKNALPFSQKPVKQTNYYFETKKMGLKQQQCALRIREKGNTYTLTLKQPQYYGILETHDQLTKEEFQEWINNCPVPKTHTSSLLNNMGVDISDLQYFGSLTTERFVYLDNGMEFVLDESFYLKEHDYELEIEAPTFEAGTFAFENLLNTFNIEKQEPISKIQRFFNALHSAHDGS